MVNLLNSEATKRANGIGHERNGSTRRQRGQAGALLMELFIAMAILVATALPLAFSVTSELKAFKARYNKAVAMEIVDGEMEVLVAGEWQSFSNGTQPYIVRANAANNLPPGNFLLTVSSKRLRLEWVPQKRDQGGKVAREAVAK